MDAEKSDCMRWEMGDVCVDAGARKVTRAGREIALPRLSWDLLLALLRATPDAVSLDQLMDEVWPGLVVNPETVTKRVNLLRQALGDDSHDPRYIEGVRGYGYRVVAPVKPLEGDDIAPDAGAAGSRRRWPVALVLGVAIVLTIGLAALLFYAVNVRNELPGEASSGAMPAVAPPPTNSLAVLPFVDMSPAGDQEYFADGLAEEIIHLLAQIDSLTVIGRTSSFSFKDQKPTIRQIGQVLGVHHILEGSVRKSGDRVRITAQLIHAGDGSHLWSQTYDRQLSDIFLVQTDVARHIADALEAEITAAERERLARQPTESLEAHTLYLKGRYFWNKRTENDIRVALDYFQQALDLDPTYALAHAGITDVWIFRGWYSRLAPRETYPQAKAAVGRALEIDPTLAEAHASLAHIHLQFDYEWDAAEQEYLRAIELNPSYPVAHHWYGGYLSAMGRHEEAMEQALRARELDPLSLIINTWVGLRHYFAGRYEEAIEAYRKALELDPDFVPGRWHLGWALGKAGRHEEAIAEARRAIELSGDNPLYVASLGHAYAAAGRDREARQVLGRLEATAETVHVSAYHVAMIHAALGDGDEAFRWLDLAYEERSPWMGYVGVDPRSEQLRPDPRFARLLERMRLPM